MTNPIFVLSGPPAAGKSTVAVALLQHFPRGIHIPVDTIRNWVVSGLSDPIGSWNAETERQFRLARRTAAQSALVYADAGFAVVIDDVVAPEHYQTHYAPYLGIRIPYRIVLLPSLAVTLERSVQRAKDFDTSQLNELIPALHNYFNQHDLATLSWHVIDSSSLSVKETALEILTQVTRAAN